MTRPKPFTRKLTLHGQPVRCAHCRWPVYEGGAVFVRVDGDQKFCSSMCGRMFRLALEQHGPCDCGKAFSGHQQGRTTHRKASCYQGPHSEVAIRAS